MAGLLRTAVFGLSELCPSTWQMGVNILLVRHTITFSEIDPMDLALNGPPGQCYEVTAAYRYSNGRPKRTVGVLQEYCRSTAGVRIRALLRTGTAAQLPCMNASWETVMDLRSRVNKVVVRG
jgi:hypothetical protein